MRIKLDENIPAKFKRMFSEFGHDAETVFDEGIAGAPDPDVMMACVAEDRVLLTQDLDFADIRAYPPSECPGIVVLRLATQELGALLEVGRTLLEMFTQASPKGHLWIVDGVRVRIRE